MRIYLYAFLLFLFCFSASAQQISNVRAVADSSVVTILYDLQGNLEGQLFKVELYSSHNDFSTPLLYVSGDAGSSIQPGKDKKIIWQTRELTIFEGQVTFDVRAILSFSPFVLKSPGKSSGYKRGKSYQIDWIGGAPSEKVTLELYRNNVKVSSLSSTANKGNFQWNVPAKSKPGGNYQLKVGSEENPDNFNLSHKFSIRRRVPLLAKIVPIALIGAGAYVIFSQDKGPVGPTGPEWLPEPDLPQ